MTHNKVLKSMLSGLSNALSENEQSIGFFANYENQCALYEDLLCSTQSENELICGRCLIALSRSLAAEEIKKDSIRAVKKEVEILKNVFCRDGKSAKKQIEAIVHSRIETLSCAPSDEVIDAVLFLYLSLR